MCLPVLSMFTKLIGCLKKIQVKVEMQYQQSLIIFQKIEILSIKFAYVNFPKNFFRYFSPNIFCLRRLLTQQLVMKLLTQQLQDDRLTNSHQPPTTGKKLFLKSSFDYLQFFFSLFVFNLHKNVTLFSKRTQLLILQILCFEIECH